MADSIPGWLEPHPFRISRRSPACVRASPSWAHDGGAGGGGSGEGTGDGDGSDPNGGAGEGADASGDGRNGGEGCGDPVCPITGKVFVEIFDFGFAGPMPLRWTRQYSSRTSNRAGELGFGWTHSYGHRLRERRDSVELIDDGMRLQHFDKPGPGNAVTHPLGLNLRRTASGFLLTDRDGTRRYFGPPNADDINFVERVVDRNDNAITLERDARGTLTGIVDAAGRRYRITTDPSGRILSISVTRAAENPTWLEVVRYTYDAEGNLASATDAEGFIGHYGYANHLLVRHDSPEGPTYVYRYDGDTRNARCVETYGVNRDGTMPKAILDEPRARGTAKGIYYQNLTYIPSDYYCEADDGLGGLIRYFGDEKGRVVKRVDASGAVETFAFDPENGVISARTATDDSGAAVQVADAKPQGFRAADGQSVDRTVDSEGFVVSTYISMNGSATLKRRYDERGNLRLMVHPDGSLESFDVDARGLLTRWFNRRGAVTQYMHDAMGNCTAITHPGNLTEQMEYDYLGRRIRHVDPTGLETKFKWDNRNEVIEKTTSAGHVVRSQYNASRKVVVLDVAGKIYRHEYGGQDWLTRVTEPGGAVTEYWYDIRGEQVLFIDALGRRFESERDRNGNPVRWKTFEDVEYRARFDVMGRVTRVSCANETSLCEYDPASRLARIAFNDGTEAAFVYGGRGGPIATTGSVVPTERMMDPLGKVYGERMGQHLLEVRWNSGEAAGLTADVGAPIQYDFDASGRLGAVRVGTKTRIVDRLHQGDLLSELGDALVLRRRFGGHGRIVLQAIGKRAGLDDDLVAMPGGPGTLVHVEYEYDNRGNLVKEVRSDGRTITYGLNVDDRVASRTEYKNGKTLNSETIAYDAIGTPRMVGSTYDVHGRPTSHNGESFEYDALGRLSKRTTDKGIWTYEWNALDQLLRVSAPSHIVDMEYDARGRRLKKRVRTGKQIISSTSYIWNNNIVIHEVDELSGRTRTYDRVDGSWSTFGHVDREGDVEKAYHYLLTPIGTVDLVLDEEGNIAWNAETTTFGHRQVTVDNIDVTARFPNQFWDEDVGLSYTWHRWYDPRLGVFVTQEPLFLDGNFNPRAFCHNPLEDWDATGWHNIPVPAGMTPAAYIGRPGTNARPASAGPPGSIPCPPHMRVRSGRPHVAHQAGIDAAGDQYGCHSCGATHPGTTAGAGGRAHWVGDHQPPLSTMTPAQAATANIRLYPHCINCARSQGGSMSHHATTVGPNAALAANASPNPACP
jgi:RHS repeat-associated protein